LHTVIMVIHCGFFCEHILLSAIIGGYSHVCFVKNCYKII
jgi:hypothetical protein